ncbi:17.1 kDa class II heat shock protein [Ziziphus jujuba]|uniref:17.1 kDa class II heat shock protein n=2 Tax=Ziziphus jujuba TaxID=326968 RepID=A0A6P4A8G4_ZIZJJ|nr:17.1 kDa class II heat shock protein [Ziziphus jujuba]KAH7523855.1 hypothetical protein FEM48_Zijuj06G0056300 [Ziziphus jujuba var. spinosa]
MDPRGLAVDPWSLMDTIHDILDFSDESAGQSHHPSRAYVRDNKAMANTPADVKEDPNAYIFVVDMPGLKSDQIKVQVEDSTLVVSGERRREKEKDQKDGVKYIRMERRVGKFLKKFVLPENADIDKISAVSQDGVLTVTVAKKPPPEPKKPKTVEVQIG